MRKRHAISVGALIRRHFRCVLEANELPYTEHKGFFTTDFFVTCTDAEWAMVCEAARERQIAVAKEWT